MTPPNGGRPVGVAAQIASPLNDYQLVGIMSAILMAREPHPTSNQERNEQADLATTRAIDLLGFAAYKTGRGAIAAIVNGGLAQGAQDLKAALEAEEKAQRGDTGEPPPQPRGGGTARF